MTKKDQPLYLKRDEPCRVIPPDPHRWYALAQYNSEIGRGIVHTREYDMRMALEQRAFSREQGCPDPRPDPLIPPPVTGAAIKIGMLLREAGYSAEVVTEVLHLMVSEYKEDHDG